MSESISSLSSDENDDVAVEEMESDNEAVSEVGGGGVVTAAVEGRNPTGGGLFLAAAEGVDAALPFLGGGRRAFTDVGGAFSSGLATGALGRFFFVIGAATSFAFSVAAVFSVDSMEAAEDLSGAGRGGVTALVGGRVGGGAWELKSNGPLSSASSSSSSANFEMGLEDGTDDTTESVGPEVVRAVG